MLQSFGDLCLSVCLSGAKIKLLPVTQLSRDRATKKIFFPFILALSFWNSIYMNGRRITEVKSNYVTPEKCLITIKKRKNKRKVSRKFTSQIVCKLGLYTSRVILYQNFPPPGVQGKGKRSGKIPRRITWVKPGCLLLRNHGNRIALDVTPGNRVISPEIDSH